MKITPKIFNSLTTEKSEITGEHIEYFLGIHRCIYLHLWVFNCRLTDVDPRSVFACSWRQQSGRSQVMGMTKVESLTIVVESQTGWRELTTRLKRKGPITDPCGMPEFIGRVQLWLFAILTICVRLVRYSWIHWIKPAGKLFLRKVSIITSWPIWSKALLKSYIKMTTSRIASLSRASLIIYADRLMQREKCKIL